MVGVLLSFVPIEIVTQPGTSRTNSGEKQERKPEVIAVLVEEGALGAVDDGCRSPMHRQPGVFFISTITSLQRRLWVINGPESRLVRDRFCILTGMRDSPFKRIGKAFAISVDQARKDASHISQ